MFEFIGSIIGYIAGVAFCLFVLFVIASLSFSLIKMLVIGAIDSIKNTVKISEDVKKKDYDKAVRGLTEFEIDSNDSMFGSGKSDSHESDDVRKMKAEISKAVRDGIAMSDLEHGRSTGAYGTSDDLFLK